MSNNLPLWRSSGLLHPLRFFIEASKDEAAFGLFLIEAMDLFVSLKGSKQMQVTHVGLEGEVVELKRQMRVRRDELMKNPKLDTPSNLWMWWRSLKLVMPNWFGVAKILVILQPSSAMVERFFSLLKAYTSPLQNSEAHETRAARAMLLYNEKK